MQIVVAHNAIEGFMPAMTMAFNVKDPRPVEMARRGQFIEATLVVDGQYSWLEKGSLRPGNNISPEQKTSVSAGARPGDEVPDFALVNQDGQPISLAQYRGRALALTFIYVRCPLPEFCPLLSKNFAAIEQELGADPELRDRTRLLSISFDPENDTPEVLKKYADTYRPPGTPPDHWQFATGTSPQVAAVTGFFGLTFAEGRQVDHSLRTIVIRPDGRVHRVYIGNDWRAADLMADLRSAVEGAQAGS
jgi:protein SCO1/2